jgi:hypothetical protein
MVSFTFMKQLLFSAKLAAVRLRRVAEFILVRGIMRATLVTFSSISIALAYSQQAPASPRMTVFGRWYRGGPEVETHVTYLNRSNFTFSRSVSTNRQECTMKNLC